jgi:predicted glutamine amidotransferase
MCGIIGVAGKIDNKLLNAFKGMLVVNQLRGTDATGVIRVNSAGGYKYKKSLGTPNYLMETKFFDREIDIHGAKALIGHCRAKTIGDNIVANAHPFEHGNIIGVHNGTLQGHYTMERARQFDVDSDWLYWHISEYGLKDTISQLDNTGAWALVYWDNKERTLNFLRNERRPLYFAHTKDQKAMLWASEPWFFSAATRIGVELHKDDAGKSFFELPIETHLSFTIDAYKDKPSEIFTLKVENDVKGEVRSYSGNVTHLYGSGGRYGSSIGGSVPSPFVDKDLLDDNLDDIGTSRPRQLPATTQTPGAATHTASTVDKSQKSSQQNTGSSTVSTSSTNGQRPKLSLPSSSSKSCQQENSGSTARKCNDCSENCEKPKVSFRTVSGIPFITDNKTKTEFSEQRFEQLTGAVCTFCKSPVGDLDEVHEIFIHSSDRKFDKEYVTFICRTCVEPNPALVVATMIN